MAHRTCVSVCDGEISGSSSAGIVESSAQFASGKKEGSIRELEKIEKGFFYRGEVAFGDLARMGL